MDVETLLARLGASCAELGVEVLDAELLRGGAGGRSSTVLRVTVERAGEPLDLDAVAAVSSVVSAALDAEDAPVPAGRYDLEVTSPGVERRLRRPGHFARAVGSKVALKTRPGVAGDRRVEGYLQDVDGDGVTVSLEGGTRRLGFDEIELAHTVFDWRTALAAGSRREHGPGRAGRDTPPPSGAGARERREGVAR